MNIVRNAYIRAGAAAGAVTLAGGLPGLARAATSFDNSSAIGPGGTADFSGTTGGDIKSNIATLATYVLNIILLLSGILAVFFLIYSGIQYITSAGNPDKIKTARGGIINAIIGIIVIVAAYFIIKVAISVGGSISKQTVN